MFKIKKQIWKLYGISALSNLSLAGASWVALLAARGFTMVEIGIGETIFHITCLLTEIPSGMLADVLGRKKMLILGRIMSVLSAVAMIVSRSFFEVAISLIFSALSYSLASGTGEALAYDSLKLHHAEQEYEKYASTQTILYRIFNGASTLCAGLALLLGYQLAEGIDAVLNAISLLVAMTLVEVPASEHIKYQSLGDGIKTCFLESFHFLKHEKQAVKIMLGSSVVGAIAVLLLFFLQAKLPMAGLPDGFLGPALFIMGMGGVVGAKAVFLFKNRNYKNMVILCLIGACLGLLLEQTGNYILMCFGGFLAACCDDLIQVHSDALLNQIVPSNQRATLISVSSVIFSLIMIALSPLAGVMFSVM